MEAQGALKEMEEAEEEARELEEAEDLLEYYLQRAAATQSEAERLLAGARDLEESIGVSLSARRFEVRHCQAFFHCHGAHFSLPASDCSFSFSTLSPLPCSWPALETWSIFACHCQPATLWCADTLAGFLSSCCSAFPHRIAVFSYRNGLGGGA